MEVNGSFLCCLVWDCFGFVLVWFACLFMWFGLVILDQFAIVASLYGFTIFTVHV